MGRTIVIITTVLATVFILGACTKPTVAPEPEPAPAPAPTPQPSPEPEPAPTMDNSTPTDLEAARKVVFEYWAAFNSYDVERALSYYEEHYREQEREEVEGDISRLKQFGITLLVEELSEPALISEGKVEYEVRLNTPIGYRYLLYELIQIDGEWKICLESSAEKLLSAKEFIIDFLAKYGESQQIDIVINAEQKEGIEQAVIDRALSDLIKSGEIVELREGVYSLPGEQQE